MAAEGSSNSSMEIDVEKAMDLNNEGKIIADKVVNFQAMRNTMAMLWRPLQGVQVHKAPCGCRSEKVVKSIGNYVGTYVESDEKNFDGSWKEFIRVKIKIDVSKPIMAFMKIKKPGGDWLNLEFNYERLGIACFICGRVGHSDKFYRCLLEFENIVYKLSKEVRAPPRRSQTASAGEIWLRDGGRGGRGSEWKNPYDYGNSAIRVDSPTENDTINLKEIFKGGDYASNLGLDGRKNLDFEDSGGLDKERVIFIEGKRRKMDEVVTTSQIEEGILGHKEPQAHGALAWTRPAKSNEYFVLELSGAWQPTNSSGPPEVVMEDGDLMRVTGFYGNPCRNRRKDNWDLLRSLASVNNSPWIFMGDFNDILNHREKRGGDSGLVDLGFQGCPFTWERGRGSGLWVQERLDRVLGNGDWVARHKDARVVHLDSVVYDHLPIILHLYRVEGREKTNGFVYRMEGLRREMGRLQARTDDEGLKEFSEVSSELGRVQNDYYSFWRQRAKQL
ncbi:conserved hypothetical protein [Ricinus communis]|uniref:Zinc knuckle CX2CX4HX4C domain-containing protein n=1 Tax=Ricinus communis TaxID=3988 RepID=B9RGA0_RICCO|nr:conserved hypothetical protein [Ricinus communis]